ncbi:MAG: IS66 family transposase [Acholeplasmataceae bacterium]|nr:IS66 family transposase [Acholeplasmataceae bacterium]
MKMNVETSENTNLKDLVEKLKLEISSLKTEKDNLRLENSKLTLEKDNLKLENSNLTLEKEELLALIYDQEKAFNDLLKKSLTLKEKYNLHRTKPFVKKNERIKEVVINEVEETIKKDRKPTGRKKGGTNFKNTNLEALVTKIKYEDPIFSEDINVSSLTLVSQKERYVVETIPASISITKIIKRTYKCPKTNKFYYPLSNEVFPGSILTPSFASYIAYHKYELGIPFYHLESHLSNTLKMDISKQLMSVWMKNISYKLEPLFLKMKADLKNNNVKVIYADETTLVVSKKPLEEINRKYSYVYVFSTSFYDKPINIYEFHESRKIDQVSAWLNDYGGYLVCDDYKGYSKLKKNNPNIKLQRCFAHVRRKFTDLLKALPEKERPKTVSYEIVGLINKLFHFEALYRREKLTASVIKENRNKEHLPILNKLKELIFNTAPSPNSLLEKALNYTKNIWSELITYLDYPYLEISNNLAERAVKPFVINRKVFMTSGSYAGAIYTTKLFSIIRTALINNLCVEKYLTYVLENIDELPINELLPYSDKLPKNLRVTIKVR